MIKKCFKSIEFFFLSLFIFCLNVSTASDVLQCNAVHFDLNVTETTNFTQLYTLSFDVKVLKSNKLFYNDVTLFNFSRWSKNSSLYYEFYPLYFFVQGMSKDVMCNSTDGICLVKYMRDGIGSVSFNLALSNELETSEWFMNYWFIDGTIYNSWGGRMFHPEKDPCFHDRLDCKNFIIFFSEQNP